MAKGPISYDAAVIQEFARWLYSEANYIIFTSTLLGVIVGALLGGGSAAATHGQAMGVAVLIGAVIGGWIGFSRGRERAFKLKLDAQMALCHVQIEKNTQG